MTRQELSDSAFIAAKKAFEEVAKCANPETGEPSFEDAVQAARNAAIAYLLGEVAAVVRNTYVLDFGLAPTAVREAICARLRNLGGGE